MWQSSFSFSGLLEVQLLLAKTTQIKRCRLSLECPKRSEVLCGSTLAKTKNQGCASATIVAKESQVMEAAHLLCTSTLSATILEKCLKEESSGLVANVVSFLAVERLLWSTSTERQNILRSGAGRGES